MAAKALLDREPDASEERIRFFLAGNLCRCTGYDKIVRAVMDAAKQMQASRGAANGLRAGVAQASRVPATAARG